MWKNESLDISTLYKRRFNIFFLFLERWMVMQAPLFDLIMQHALALSFGLPLPEPGLIPKTDIHIGPSNPKCNTKLQAMEVVFLNSALPHEYRKQWRPLFNSRYSVPNLNIHF